MEIVKLTKDEIETLVEVTARRCYENYEFNFWNGEEVRLFRYKTINTIVDETFFEIFQFKNYNIKSIESLIFFSKILDYYNYSFAYSCYSHLQSLNIKLHFTYRILLI